MDTNSKQNTLQINTFTGGMNTDTSDMYLKSDLYRYAENLRVVTDENSNTGELHLIEGTKKLNLVDKEGNAVNIYGEVLSFDSINNLGVIILKQDQAWCAYTLKPDSEDTYIATLIAGPFSDEESLLWNRETDIDESGRLKIKPISTLVRSESESLSKVYITDGIHLVFAIPLNITTPITDFNKFFAEQLITLPQPKIEWSDTGVGSLNGVKFQYVYSINRPYSTRSFWSAVSGTLTGYSGYSKGLDFVTDETTGDITYKNDRPIKILIPDLELEESFQMKVYRIAYVKNGADPIIHKIIDQDFTSFSFLDSGGGVEEEDVNSFMENVNRVVFAKEIASDDKYMFFANVMYGLDNTELTFNNFDARCYSRGNYYLDSDGRELKIVSGDESFINDKLMRAIKLSNLRQDEFSNSNPYFNKFSWLYFTINGQEFNGIGPCFKWRYCLKSTVNPILQLSSDDNKDDDSVRSYRSGEVYRFGVILFDKHGLRSNVKWIADILMPNLNEDLESIVPNEDGSSTPTKAWYNRINITSGSYSEEGAQFSDKTYATIRNLGIEFVPRNVGSDFWDGVYAYLIVQSPRTFNKKRTLFLGICGYPIMFIDENKNKHIYHPGFLTPNNQIFEHNIINNNDYIEARDWAPIVSQNVTFGIYGQVSGDYKYLAYTAFPEGDRNRRGYGSSYTKTLLFACPELSFLGNDKNEDGTYTNKELLWIIGSQNLKIERVALLTPNRNTLFNRLSVPGRGYDVGYAGSELGCDAWIANHFSNYEALDLVAMAQKPPKDVLSGVEAWLSMFVTPCKRMKISWPFPSEHDKSVTITYGNSGTVNYNDCYLYDSGWVDLNTRFGYYGTVTNNVYDRPGWQLRKVIWGTATGGNVGFVAAAHPNNELLQNYYPSGLYSGNSYYSMGAILFPKSSNISNLLDASSLVSNIKNTVIVSQPDNQLLYNFSNFDNAVPISSDTGDYINWFAPAHIIAHYHTKCTGDDAPKNLMHCFGGHPDFYTERPDKAVPGAKGRITINQDDWLVYNVAGSNLGQWGMLAASMYPVASGGSLMIFDLDKPENLAPIPYNSSAEVGMPLIDIRNVTKTPIFDYDESSIINSQYITTPAYSNEISNNKSVLCFYGDCYIKPFVYYATHFTPKTVGAVSGEFEEYGQCQYTKCVIQYIVPLETEIDVRGQNSSIYSPTEENAFNLKIQDIITSSADGSINQNTVPYIYNTAYSIMPNVPQYNSTSKYNIPEPYETRIHWTNPAENREEVDSWRPDADDENYIDLDTKYGNITAIKVINDKLLFWQKHATGIVSINERVILLDENDSNISIGSAEKVLDRYNYISTIYGMKPYQRAFAESESFIYWWDGYKKEINKYAVGSLIQPVSTTLNIKQLIDGQEETQFPSVCYDELNKEMLFNVVEGGTIVLNELVNRFTSVYKFSPAFYCRFDTQDLVVESYINTDTGIHIYNKEQEDGKSKLFNNDANPKLKVVINENPTVLKVFDNQQIGGRLYGGGDGRNTEVLKDIRLKYFTPLKQSSNTTLDKSTNVEYDYRISVPRNNDADYGDRMRGKTMQCEISSDSNNTDFSLQYVITKFRKSWAQD